MMLSVSHAKGGTNRRLWPPIAANGRIMAVPLDQFEDQRESRMAKMKLKSFDSERPSHLPKSLNLSSTQRQPYTLHYGATQFKRRSAKKTQAKQSQRRFQGLSEEY
ncbi:hypothetical protein RB195_015416 [Necator americanus]|uniref:Uncharacterized protein n=1 Tax=Necator americanus TaxID=51031 RepID=A0ABR1E4Q0_NECAM